MKRKSTDKAGYRACLRYVLLAAIPVLLLILRLDAAGNPDRLRDKNSAPTLHLFWGKGCPHCEEEKKFIAGLKENFPGLVVREYEVWQDRQNAALFDKVMRSAGRKPAAVPATVIGKKLFIGFNVQTAKGIEDAVSRCFLEGCPDALASAYGDAGAISGDDRKALSLPHLGSVDAEKISVPVLTVVLAGLDSFNPCAFFVLLFLLSMLVHVRSRKRMLLIGGVFVFFSGLVYFLFIAAWLNLFLVIGNLAVITLTAGILALLIAGINIKDFFFYRKGVSLMIPDRAKPKLFQRMRGLLQSASLLSMLGGTVVLALTANAYELLCTAGFPMVYTRALTLRELTRFEYYIYLVLYNIVYIIPLAVIVLVVTATLGARKLTEWQGRQLKLVSGLMMFFLGLILLVEPALLNNAAASAILLAVVILLSALTIYAVKSLKPEIASE